MIKIENNNKKNIKMEKNFFAENDFDFEDEEEDDSKLHRRADVSMKMKTFMHYTSENDSKSSIDVEPNSVDNDKLHKLNKILELRNRLLYGVAEDDFYGFDYDNVNFKFKEHSLESESHKSSRSLKDYINKKKKYLNKSNSDFDNSSKKSNNIDSKDIKVNNDNKKNKNKNFKKENFLNDKLNLDIEDNEFKNKKNLIIDDKDNKDKTKKEDEKKEKNDLNVDKKDFLLIDKIKDNDNNIKEKEKEKEKEREKRGNKRREKKEYTNRNR